MVIQDKLLTWYKKNGRALPWRESYHPYHIWISEVMLQQTQMERGVEYFLNWIQRFPDVNSVAEASQQEIFKYWEGLGYYARARNLHSAAKKMVEEHGGRIPSDYTDQLAMPGVGPYTAAAISSIAFNHDVAVIDANVERVYARIFDLDMPLKTSEGRKTITAVAIKHLVPGKARDYNQALMDFGASVCLPKSPRCSDCFLQSQCKALNNSTVEKRPILAKPKKTETIRMSSAIIIHNNCYYIQQRRKDDVWGGLWEFPGGKVEPEESVVDCLHREVMEETEFRVSIIEELGMVVHYYTHYRVELSCFICELNEMSIKPVLHAAQQYKWVKFDELSQFGFSAGHRKIISTLKRFMVNEK